jgi:predicted PurR-regulated permease PerM
MNELPLTVRRSIEMMGLFFLGWLLVLGQETLAPLFMAFFISLVMLPVYRFLVSRRVPNALAITLCLVVLTVVTGMVVWFFSSQVSSLLDDLPTIRQNVTKHLNTLSTWITNRTNYSAQEQLKFINEQSNKLLSYTGQVLNGAIGSVTSVVIFLSLTPLYIFLLLLYKDMLLRFVLMWFRPQTHVRVREALAQIQSIVKDYIMGLIIQITYMTLLVGFGLMLFGIQHALLIGLMFAVLNLIPYVGAFIGNLLGALITLASSPELGPILTVLIVISVAQFLDNNILMPRIVGSKVSINSLATILGVIVGGLIAGIVGMFLALPVMAVLKVIFDRTDNLKQWGVLLGDELTVESRQAKATARRRRKS